MRALSGVQVQAANGATIGRTGGDHEGIPPARLSFAVIPNLNFQPVQDDPASKAQPQVEQD